MKHTASSYRPIGRSLLALLAVVAMVGMLSNGCRRMETPNGPTDGSPISTTIVGQVTDESGTPLAGVTVSSGPTGQTIARTDANGLYALHNISAFANHAFVVGQKSGYFNGVRAGIPTANGVTYFPITMAAKTAIGTINASAGGSVTLPTGATLTLSGGGVVTSSGAPYNGAVTVYAKHILPGSATFSALFPGDLTAQKADGSSTTLWSFGVTTAELRGSNNELLQPSTGVPATLKMPIAATEQSLAPSSISMWYFDETLGLWKEEGQATKSGNTYIGNVAHFSSWNCDYSGDWGELTGQIVCNDVPVPGVVINVGGGGPLATTDGDGKFKVRVPANHPDMVQFQVFANQNNNLFWTSTPIPVSVPANGKLDLGQIALSSPCPSYLTGQLKDCNGQLTPGMVFVAHGTGLSYVYTKDGNFRIIAPATQSVTVAATAASGDVAQPQTITAGDQGTVTNIPPIIACSGTLSDVKIDIPGTYGGILAFSPDGKKIATTNTTFTDVILLDATTGAMIKQFAAATAGQPISNIVFSPDGTELLTLKSYPGYMQARKPTSYINYIDCWQLNGTRLTPTTVNATSAVFALDSRSLYISSSDSGGGKIAGVCQYDLAQNKIVKKLAVSAWSRIIGLINGGSQLLLSSYSATIAWDITLDAQAFTLPQLSGYPLWTRLSPDALIVGIDVDSGGSVGFYSLSTRSKISTTHINGSEGGSFEIMPDNTNFLAQYQSNGANTVGLFKMTDGSPTHLFDAPSSFGISYAVGRSPDGKVAAAVYDSKIRVWTVN